MDELNDRLNDMMSEVMQRLRVNTTQNGYHKESLDHRYEHKSFFHSEKVLFV
jgi:hypothetical protein